MKNQTTKYKHIKGGKMAGERLIHEEAAEIKGDFHDGHVILETGVGPISKGVPLGLATLYRDRASRKGSSESSHHDRRLAAIFARMAAHSTVAMSPMHHLTQEKHDPLPEALAA